MAANETAQHISANFLDLPCPTQPNIFSDSFWVGSPVPPPTEPTISDGSVTATYKSPCWFTSIRVIPTEDSATQATSCPHEINKAVNPFATCSCAPMAPL